MEKIIEKMKEIRDIKKTKCDEKCDECILYEDFKGFSQFSLCDAIDVFDYDVSNKAKYRYIADRKNNINKPYAEYK